MPIYQLSCPIIRKTHLTTDVISLTLQCPQIVAEILPGQFIMIRVRNEVYPLLRRAFSVSRVFPREGWLEIMVQRVGTGSRILLQKEEGEAVDVLGPLGSHFAQQQITGKALLVGGGIGIAPLFFLAQHLQSQQRNFSIIFGGRSHQQIFFLEEFEPAIIPCTEDGSLGEKGLVTEVLLKQLQLDNIATVFACGPNPMLKAVARLCRERGISCQVSMEAPMACGVGVCMGCPVPLSKGGYAYVCKEGPVFPAEMVNFEQIPG